MVISAVAVMTAGISWALDDHPSGSQEPAAASGGTPAMDLALTGAVAVPGGSWLTAGATGAASRPAMAAPRFVSLTSDVTTAVCTAVVEIVVTWVKRFGRWVKKKIEQLIHKWMPSGATPPAGESCPPAITA